MELKVLLEIEQSSPLVGKGNIFTKGVWKFALWNEAYVKNLPFMADTDPVYPALPFEVSSIIVDYKDYIKVNTIDECYTKKMSFYVENNFLYVHFDKDWLHYIFRSIKFGLYIKVANDNLVMGDSQYTADLIQIPEIEEEIDNLEYAKMSFNSGSFTLNNSYGLWDNLKEFFGNNIGVMVGKDDDPIDSYKRLIQYYIGDITRSPLVTTISAKDRRERLSYIAPNSRFLKEQFPFLNDNLDNTLIPDAYGYCFKVKGYCQNEEQAISLNWRIFKFARTITSNLMDSDFILEAEIGKKWMRLPRSVNEYASLGYQGIYNSATMSITIDNANGTVSIPVLWAHDNGDPLKGINKVRLSARFNAQSTPLEIVKDLLSYYGDSPLIDEEAFTRELLTLPEIGLVIDKEKTIYEWIEKIQNSSLLGFILTTEYDMLTVKLDDTNRAETFNLQALEILNINDLEIEYLSENYASYVDILYAHGYEDNSDQHYIDKSFRNTILNIYRFDKVYTNESLLIRRIDALLKAKNILNQYTRLTPVIRGIKLFGFEYFNIKVLDTGFINFSDSIKGRAFLGKVRCKVVKRNINLQTGVMTLDVQQADPVPSWNSYLNLVVDTTDPGFIIPLGQPGSIPYSWIIDWGDNTLTDSTGVSQAETGLSHAYTDGLSTHTIKILPYSNYGHAAFSFGNIIGSTGAASQANRNKLLKVTGVFAGNTEDEYWDTAFYFTFAYCANLNEVDVKLKPAGTMRHDPFNGTFYGTVALTSLPDAFVLPDMPEADGALLDSMFAYSGLVSLPDGFSLPAIHKNTNRAFAELFSHSALTSLPDTFRIYTPETDSKHAYFAYKMFYNCTNLTALNDTFMMPDRIKSLGHAFESMFETCLSLHTLGNSFILPYIDASESSGYDMASLFSGCDLTVNINDIINNTVLDEAYIDLDHELNSAFVNNGNMTGEGVTAIEAGFNGVIPKNNNSFFYQCTNLDDYDFIPSNWVGFEKSIIVFRVNITTGNFKIPLNETNKTNYHWLIDWGDGTREEKSGGGQAAVYYIEHDYANNAVYDIIISVKSDSLYGHAALGFNNNIYGANDPDNKNQLIGVFGKFRYPRIASIAAVCMSMFYNCKNMVSISPDFFMDDTGYAYEYWLASTFYGCGIQYLPDGFSLPDINQEVNTGIYVNFFNNSNIIELPDNFRLPNVYAANFAHFFFNCHNLERLPEEFTIHAPSSGIFSDGAYNGFFYGCDKLKTLPESFSFPNIPADASRATVQAYNDVFYGCTSLEKLPDSFKMPIIGISSNNDALYKVFNKMFHNCTKLRKLPPLFKFQDFSSYTKLDDNYVPYQYIFTSALLDEQNIADLFDGPCINRVLLDNKPSPEVDYAFSRGMFYGTKIKGYALPVIASSFDNDIDPPVKNGHFSNCYILSDYNSLSVNWKSLNISFPL
jgi:hypothetical protein